MEYDGEIMFRNKRWEHSINKKPNNNEK